MRYLFDEFELDLSTRELRKKGRVLHLDRRPLQLLSYLIQNRHRVVSNAELLTRVWRIEAISASAIPTTIRTIRIALGDTAASQQMIRTVPRHGYRFIAPVEVYTDTVDLDDFATPFVGRESELNSLRDALRQCLAAVPQVVLISGEPGIGKTRLLEELGRSAASLGADVIVGRCREDSGAPAFWPWTQILRSYTDRQDRDRVRDLLRPFAPVLAQMAPEIRNSLDLVLAPLPALEPLQERFRLFDTLVRFLQSAARRVPLVLLLDDLHRADPSSLHLLQFVSQEIRDARVLIVTACRNTEITGDSLKSAILGTIARLPIARSIALAGIPVNAVDQLIHQRIPDQTDHGQLATILHEQSAGNPFFLTQLLNLIEDRIKHGNDLMQSMSALPSGIREAISLQVAGLSTGTTDVLRIAAVIGRNVDLGLLADVLGNSQDSTLARLGPAFRAGLLTEVPGRPNQVRFSHILLRNALYEEMLPGERVQLHRRVASSIESRYADTLDVHAAELAHHYRQATDLRLTVDYALLAATGATCRLAYEDAQLHCRAALEAAEFDPSCSQARRAAVLIALGEAELRAGDRKKAHVALHEAARAARATQRPDLLAQAALALAPGFFSIEVGVVDSTLIALLEEALASLPAQEVPLRAQLMARLGLALSYSNDAARSARLGSDAVELAERASDPSTLTYVLTARHPLLWGPTTTEDRLRSGERAIQAALATNHRELALVHRLFRVTDLLELGDIAAADVEVSAFTALADAIQIPQARWYTTLFRAMRSHLRGEIGQLEELAAQVASEGQRVGDRNATLSFLVLLEAARVEQGRFAELIPMIERIRDEFPAIDIPWRCGTAWGFAESRLPAEARRQIEFIDVDSLPRGILGLSCSTLFGTAVALVGDDPQCGRLYEILEPYGHRHAVVGYAVICLGAVARTLGMLAARLGKWDSAERHFEYALEANARLGSPLWVARTQYDYARALGARANGRDRKRARILAERSAAHATKLGLSNLAERSRVLRQSLDRRETISLKSLP